jgi:hypothetical protein
MERLYSLPSQSRFEQIRMHVFLRNDEFHGNEIWNTLIEGSLYVLILIYRGLFVNMFSLSS